MKLLIKYNYSVRSVAKRGDGSGFWSSHRSGTSGRRAIKKIVKKVQTTLEYISKRQVGVELGII